MLSHLVLIVVSVTVGIFLGVWIEYMYLDELDDRELIAMINKRRKKQNEN